MWYGACPGRRVADGVYVVEKFVQRELQLDPDELFKQLLAVPEHPADKPIEFDPMTPCRIPGDHPALSYRGRPIKRSKIWAQPDAEKACIRYGYTGWQYPIALATKDLSALPWLQQFAKRLNAGLATTSSRRFTPTGPRA